MKYHILGYNIPATRLFLGILLSVFLFTSCAKQRIVPEAEEIPEARSIISFYLNKEDKNYWVRNATVSGYEIGTIIRDKPDCNPLLDFYTYVLTDDDFNREELTIVMLYNYYPTNTFGRIATFKIPISRFKKGKCTPLEVIQNAGVLSLKTHEVQ